MKRLFAGLGLLLLVGTGCGDDEGPSGPKKQKASEPGLRVGSLVDLNVQVDSACTRPIIKTSRVVAISERAIVVADTANPSGGFAEAEYQAFATTFDELVYPVDVRNFGEPSDIDKNGKIILFFTRAVNELTEPDSKSFVGGFFYSRDLFPKTGNARLEGCLGSNVAEIMYLLAPDPAGIANNPRSKEFVLQQTVGVLAHELQHLINASRRLYVNDAAKFEEVWLNEGLSHIAEELMFFNASRVEPRQNLDLPAVRATPERRLDFNTYQAANFGRFITYLENPDTASLIGIDNLPTRGASWAFLRYAADREPGEDAPFFFRLVNSTQTGVQNLEAAINAKPVDWFQDWSVSVYTDDAVPVEARFTQPSWNFRSIMAAVTDNNNYPLRVRTLANGSPTALTLQGGGSAFLRFGVAPLGRAEIRTTSGGGALPGSCPADGSARSLNVGEVFTAGPDAVGALCVGAPAGGAEFVLIPFYASDVGTARLAIEVTGSGVLPVIGPPNPSRAPSGWLPSLSLSGDMGLVPDRSFHQKLRQIEKREVERLIVGSQSGSMRPNFASAAQTGPDQLRISIVRTK